MFKKLKGTRMNEIRKMLGMTYCIEQKRFWTEEEARAYLAEMQEAYPGGEYDVYMQTRLAYGRYQVVVLKEGWA